jgi:hypothetical protein
MDRIDNNDSSMPTYRAFLRSGSYPALSQRFARSGNMIMRATGWFALVVTAASAGYNLTQRFVTPSAAAATAPVHVRNPQADVASQPAAAPQESTAAVSQTESPAARPRPAAAAMLAAVSGAPAQSTASASRKRASNVVQPAAAPAEDDAPSSAQPPQDEQVAERVRALEDAPQTARRVEARASEPAADDSQDPLEALMLRRTEPSAHAEPEPHAAPAPVEKPREVRAPWRPSVAASPAVTAVPAPAAPTPHVVVPSAGLPLLASAKIDALTVRGPLSAAHVRRGVERVRPTLSECYAEAARRAGHNRFAQLRVEVAIDEAGRVKTLPKVAGGQLPGIDSCVSTALSKLVCQAPDTGTAQANIVLAFEPQR